MADVNDVSRAVRVLVADDDPLVRAGLAMMLGGRDDLVIVGEAGDGAEAIAQHDLLHADVVLMDIRMPVMDGLAATEALRAGAEPPEVIVLTTFDADEQVLRALRGGAAGFLVKDTPPATIIDAILRVAAGEAQLSPSVIRRLIANVTAPDPRAHDARNRLTALTDREVEVARAVGAGKTNAEIAAQLYLSVPTVKAHVSAILTKLDVTNRVQIALVVHDADAS